MCGFAGIINNKGSDFIENKIILKNMTDSLNHRGPDSEGYWCNEKQNIFLGHKRLSIVDLTQHGSQPMNSINDKLTIVFNGEIYNHNDLRRELKDNYNKNFRGSSDTETLIEAIKEWGVKKTLKKINGMFAFGLYNSENNTFILARDIVGEKPLYYSKIIKEKNYSVVFGSEIKIFNFFPLFNKKINLEAVNYQQLYKYIPNPISIYENVFKVNPGSYIEIDLSNLSFKENKYWNVDDLISSSKENLFKVNEDDNLNIIENSISESINEQLLGDVEIGAFLSGGIDSSLVTAIAQKNSVKKIKTFTVGFNNSEFNEAENAKKIANYLKTDHNEIYLNSKDLINTVPNINDIYDEPFSDSSQIPTFLISKFASKKVKVCLSGDGGDELFAGYNRYYVTKKSWKFITTLPYFFRFIVSKILLAIPPHNWDKILSKIEFLIPKYNKFIHYGDKIHKGAECLNAKNIMDLYYVLISDLKYNYQDCILNFKFKHMELPQLENNNLNSVEYLMRNDFINYLPNDILTKVDRAAMSNSLETRMPFLSKKIITNSWRTPYSLKIKNNQSKYILKNILYKYLPKNMIENKKKGFSLPLADWLRGDLRSWAEDYISKNSIEKFGIFDYKKTQDLWHNHLSFKQNNHSQIWNILVTQTWLEKNL
jgi:asparagine synthase (glutamine-hydrolysing)